MASITQILISSLTATSAFMCKDKLEIDEAWNLELPAPNWKLVLLALGDVMVMPLLLAHFLFCQSKPRSHTCKQFMLHAALTRPNPLSGQCASGNAAWPCGDSAAPINPSKRLGMTPRAF